MAELPKRRKLYLEPFFVGAGLPKTTKYRSDCAERSHAQRIRDDCGVSTASANDPSAPGNCFLNNSAPDDRQAVREVGDYKQSGSLAADEQDDCEVSGSPVVDEQDCSEECGKRAVDQEQSSGTIPPDFDSDFSVEDLVTLVMDFAVTSGLPWTQLEKLMKFVYYLNRSADSPTRAIMQNMMQYNGYFGCGWCLRPGEGTVKYPVAAASVPDRTQEGTESDMTEAFETSAHVRGVKGPLALINLSCFGNVWSFSPDYVHCVLLGLTRQFLELWLFNVGAPYYIGSPLLLKDIDKRLCHIKPPQCMARLPRPVLLLKFWKASRGSSGCCISA
ncbi:hypothetical protein HPB47_017759 [Ixodes persulcatus]|uniref:Uncharacterized protein n=1 Tax=Ixodes persulcatus TaxID=34615 RepID=A0AC60QPH3_IXOPE|nr:hypothetical protein HPB47_017759 [Ixodes persulcatus]